MWRLLKLFPSPCGPNTIYKIVTINFIKWRYIRAAVPHLVLFGEGSKRYVGHFEGRMRKITLLL